MTKECDGKPDMNIKRITTLMDITDLLYMAILVPQWHTSPVSVHTQSQHVPLLQ